MEIDEIIWESLAAWRPQGIATTLYGGAAHKGRSYIVARPVPVEMRDSPTGTRAR